MPAISTRTKFFVILPVAAVAAGAAFIATTETASAFPRGGGMRPMMMARPHVRPTNVEMTVKVLDGRPIYRPYGAMSNVDYTITVTDTQTGRVRRPPVRSRNTNAGDPGNWEMTVKVLNAPSASSFQGGKFRVIEREMLN